MKKKKVFFILQIQTIFIFSEKYLKQWIKRFFFKLSLLESLKNEKTFLWSYRMVGSRLVKIRNKITESNRPMEDVPLHFPGSFLQLRIKLGPSMRHIIPHSVCPCTKRCLVEVFFYLLKN